MITATFIHLPGVGPVRERAMWEAGLDSWHRVVAARPGEISGLREGQRQQLARCMLEAASGSWRSVAAGLKPADQWRALCLSDRDGVRPLSWLALDIETTGLSPGADAVTVVGLCGHATDFEPLALVADQDGWEDELRRLLGASDVLLTTSANWPLRVP